MWASYAIWGVCYSSKCDIVTQRLVTDGLGVPAAANCKLSYNLSQLRTSCIGHHRRFISASTSAVYDGASGVGRPQQFARGEEWHWGGEAEEGARLNTATIYWRLSRIMFPCCWRCWLNRMFYAYQGTADLFRKVFEGFRCMHWISHILYTAGCTYKYSSYWLVVICFTQKPSNYRLACQTNTGDGDNSGAGVVVRTKPK